MKQDKPLGFLVKLAILAVFLYVLAQMLPILVSLYLFGTL